jgi:hypothetical protein
MARIKISDLKENTKISRETLRRTFGGFTMPTLDGDGKLLDYLGIFNSSISAMNDDKEYWLTYLSDQHDAAEAIGDALKDLLDSEQKKK